MAWFGDGLPSLSNLKGQITNFTKEVLSEGIVEEIDERSRALNEANEKCVELQELLNSKDAEISLLRRQNYELQKTVVELNEKPKDSNDTHQDDEGEVFFWDPLSAKNRNSKNQNHVRQLQEQLAQATMRIRDLETELKCVQKVNNSSLKEELADGHQKAEFLRAKQDMVNRIIQMEEKNREAERNTKRMQSDETALINDFRTVLSKLNSLEKLGLVRNALKALETENEKYSDANEQEKSDSDEKLKKHNNTVGHESVAVKPNFDVDSDLQKRNDGFIEASNNRESELYKKIEELQEENKRLFTSVEQLDQQHEESIEQLLTLKGDIEKKHQCLQNAYEQLYVDYNQAQDKVVQLESRLANTTKHVEIETVSHPVQTAPLEIEDRLVQTDALGLDEQRNDKTAIDELTAKVKDILKNSLVETEPGVSIFEAVAKQYVDAKWKKDVLEKRVTELNRELKGAVEMKDNLQVECYDMQTHIDSLVLEIQDLKLNLPSIPEASEERVAWLESESESLHEEVKRLQAENAALKRENGKLGGGGLCEIRLDNQGYTAAGSRNRKLTKLEDIPECIEETDSAMENLNRRLHATLDENEELQRKVDILENTEKETQEQLRMSMEKCKGLDENIEFTEELKLELENVKRELKTSTSVRKQLENNLTLSQSAKDEVDKKNKELSLKIEQLETEISKCREINLKEENKDVLQDLQKQFNIVSCEKDYLKDDILDMRWELSQALNQIDSKESHIAKLSQDNENLMKEKNSLLEQLTAIQDESNDKIDLVNTEKTLLEQEQMELKEIDASKEKELNELKERLRETEEKYTKLQDEFTCANVKAEQFRLQSENLQSEMVKQEELRNELDRTMSIVERLSSVENDYTQLVKEVETLRAKEETLIALQEHFSKLTEENRNLISLNETIQNNCKQLEQEMASLEAQKKELVNHANENTCDDEKQQIIALLEEKTRENDALRNDNDKLMAEIIESQKKLQNIVESNTESTDMAKQTIESLSHLIKEKDEEINGLKATIDLVKNSTETSDSFATIKNERDELVKLVTAKHNESLQYHSEIQRLTHLLNEQASQIQALASERDVSLSQLAEKNAELLWTKNELQVAQQRLKNVENSSSSETCGIVEHSAQMAEIALLNEKCNALEAALIQEQSNNRMLQHQITESQNKEANAAKELERLRTHLVEIESSYTEEALIAEEARNELEAKLLQAEEKVKSSSTAYTSANIRANQQVETLQQQMALIVQQRDDIQNKLSIAEDTILSQAASLTNLQIVLEQFQRDKERDIMAAMERLQVKLKNSYKKQEELANDVTNLKEQLAEAKECLQAASRLSEQLDKKTERIEQLNQEVDRLANLVNTADQRIEEAKQSGEGKVDKTLIKNLLLGYLVSSAADKSSVLRVFSTILDFDEVEKEKAGLNNAAAQSSWFSRLSSGSTVPNKDQDASLSAAFVRFLESESKPKPQLPALPIQTSSLPRPGHSRQHSTSSTQSTLLLSNVNLPTFPDFVPARNTGSILKEVLKDS
ncbi:thyroid receptor-interacting protein 11-like isoform X1 [Hylaeus volcanicus]|uniref:thyroid receptor-interacting protein 11-like isoform X1 n=2 Tax=Hylaeus volcanicus TaxID=313075 RepID=UPI0023B7E607|nr:thyroid receptor-interacting protein 11-like isoform X1 [Hylaeus volcanicus]